MNTNEIKLEIEKADEQKPLALDIKPEVLFKINLQAGAQGLQGGPGPQGVSIVSIRKTATEGLIDTYTIELSNGQRQTFQISNGTGLSIVGSYNSFAELEEAHPTGKCGELYLVEGVLYTWNSESNKWEGAGDIQGEPGTTYTPKIGTITTVGSTEPASANVEIEGTDAKFNFSIPQGPIGKTGATPQLKMGTVTTLAPGENASASIGGTAEEPVINLEIPQGEKGEGTSLASTLDSGLGLSSSNPLILSKLKPGIYFFKSAETAAALTLYLKASEENTEWASITLSAGFIEIFKDINELEDNEIVGWCITNEFGACYISKSSSSNTGLSATKHTPRTIYPNKNTNNSETIGANWNFTTLPKSSIVPTEDTQFTNKKYVDEAVDNAEVDLTDYYTKEEVNKLKQNKVLSGVDAPTDELGEDGDVYYQLYTDDYSTDEEKIGKWIDGKTIYRKTIKITNIKTQTETSLPIDIDDVERILKIDGCVYNGTYGIPINFSNTTSASYSNWAYYRYASKDIYYKFYWGTEAYIVLEYTKTTD